MSPFLRILFASLLLVAIIMPGDAQTTGKKKFVKPETTESKPADQKPSDSKAPQEKPAPVKVEKEPSKWGYGLNLGNIYFSNQTFEIGLDPNVAYRLDDALAVGFMLKMNYYYAKYPQYELKYTAFDFGPTVFTRWKPLLKAQAATPFMQGIFLQAEFEHSYVSREQVDEFGNLVLNDEGTRILTEKNPEDYLYIGAGLSSGYPFSSFISFHYNILDNVELSRVPFTYRLGFTWNY
jgi:long-subunit fatty acid transport protein